MLLQVRFVGETQNEYNNSCAYFTVMSLVSVSAKEISGGMASPSPRGRSMQSVGRLVASRH